MADNEKDNILYRPELAPEKNYRSDDEFRNTNVPNLPVGDNKKTRRETALQVRSDLEEVSDLLKRAAPNEVRFLADTVDKLANRISVVDIYPGWNPPPQPKKYNPPPIPTKTEINIIGHIPQEDNPYLQDLPQLFPKTSPVNIQLEEPQTLIQIVQDEYNRDEIELQQYYLHSLQIILQRYFQQMLMAMADCNFDSIDDLTEDFDGDYLRKQKLIPEGKNLEHLSDSICRSQVTRKQKSRLFQKTHVVDNTLKHMRALNAAASARARYYGEEYKDSGTYSESHSNSLLREARKNYDDAYKESLYSMYKYLNSSTKIINDILNMTVKEAQAKAMLAKAGVPILEHEPIKIPTDNSGQGGDGSGSGFDEAANSNNGDKKDGKTVAQATDKQYANDLKYLENQGYTEEQANEMLAKLPQYKERLGKKSENQASDKQYANDLKYLEDHGYTKEMADAELAKLPQYKERLGKKTKEVAQASEKQYANDVAHLLNHGYTKQQADETLSKLPQYKNLQKGSDGSYTYTEPKKETSSILSDSTKKNNSSVSTGKTSIFDVIFQQQQNGGGCFGNPKNGGENNMAIGNSGIFSGDVNLMNLINTISGNITKKGSAARKIISAAAAGTLIGKGVVKTNDDGTSNIGMAKIDSTGLHVGEVAYDGKHITIQKKNKDNNSSAKKESAAQKLKDILNEEKEKLKEAKSKNKKSSSKKSSSKKSSSTSKSSSSDNSSDTSKS